MLNNHKGKLVGGGIGVGLLVAFFIALFQVIPNMVAARMDVKIESISKGVKEVKDDHEKLERFDAEILKLHTNLEKNHTILSVSVLTELKHQTKAIDELKSEIEQLRRDVRNYGG